jgi:hypothetical protein
MEDPIRSALAMELALAQGIEELEYAQAILKFYDMGLVEISLDKDGRPTQVKLPTKNLGHAQQILQDNQESKED